VVRLRLKVSVGERSLSVVALLNSGYEAPSPQLLIPINLAKQLGLWPPENAFEVEYETAGGLLKAWLYPRVGRVCILYDGNSSKEVDVDIVVSPITTEPLISDALAEELEIAVESFGRGLWRFRWEPKEIVRKSEKREF
jgi:hypothetical protein